MLLPPTFAIMVALINPLQVFDSLRLRAELFFQQSFGNHPARPEGSIAAGPSRPYDFSVRAVFGDEAAFIYAWPSRGGVIVLDEPEAIDLEFLGLDRLDPPSKRSDRQAEEDEFCQRLLLLGAKWWDSEERLSFAAPSGFGDAWPGNMRSTGIHSDTSFRKMYRPDPTMREKRWIKVGWPSTGGLVVSEFDTMWGPGPIDEENLTCGDGQGLALLKMARTMDERCQLLMNRFRGKHYDNISKYDGQGFLNAWEWKHTGEVGPLLTPEQTIEDWLENRHKRSDNPQQVGS